MTRRWLVSCDQEFAKNYIRTSRPGGTGPEIPYQYPVSSWGYEKKMDTSTTGGQNAKLSTLEHITVSTDGIASSAAAGEAIKWFKRTYL